MNIKIKGRTYNFWLIYKFFHTGYGKVAFLFGLSNFLLLTYNFLPIKEYLTLIQYISIAVMIGVPFGIFLGKYSWVKGEQRKSIDLTIRHNPFYGDLAKAWIKLADGETEESKQIMEKYINCGTEIIKKKEE